ncbi:F-box/FBD/LRR-repeat protein At5g56420-like [Vigna unguiculata]|uniref:F-box/FBD/LRR-repeat protein At5g56420-like n=1 Tax=Vigna unguiculata TaxID=3917 RepID=UPI0010164282|nr:F-box/FBD/LRR-repeat protein At5g56420-like [Vigna unguiculata]
MADRISNLPDSIVSHILSFVPTKEVVATSVLSKRWNILWRSVPSFDFDYNHTDISSDKVEEAYSHFLHSVYSFLLWRDMDQPLRRFRLRCYFMHPLNIETWIKVAVSGSAKVRHLDLDMSCVLPSVVFSCKTLVVLKLTNLTVEDICFVDLPLLKILHLNHLRLLKDLDLSNLLSGCLNLEDMEVKNLVCESKGTFNRLPKLVRASIHEHLLPLEIVKDVEVLFIDWIYQRNLAFDFQNLVQLELMVQLSKDWHVVLEVLKHCPKLQTLVICIFKISLNLDFAGHEEVVLPYPEPVPACILLHLKTCSLKDYSGSIDEFQFARYIMENAKYLRTMTICTGNDADNNTHGEKLDMARELSSCMKSSNTCTLSFE